MLSINSYNIAQFYWNPVDFNPVGNQFKLKKTPLLFNNGMSFNLYDCFSNLNDIKYNNNTGLLLTDLYNNTDILEDNNKPNIFNNLSYIDTIIISNSGGYFRYDKNNFYLYNSKGNVFNIDDKVRIILNSNSTVSIQSNTGFYLTDQNILGTGSLIFQPKNYNLVNQKFDYILGDDNIILFRNDSQFSTIVTEDLDGFLSLSALDIKTNQLPQESIISILTHYSNQKNNDTTADSFLVKYDANPLLNQGDLKINQKLNYSQNYLCIFPYESFNVLGGITSVDFYIHGLKNYQTSEYNYNNNNLNRVYKRIYSGTNQNKGSDKLYLGYEASTKQISFEPNTKTQFYYSATADVSNLSNSTLISDGAIGGTYPQISDRITVKTRNNFNELNELSFLSQDNQNNNSYLCSWLSKSSNGFYTWYDRYYNAAYYSMDQALSASKLVYNDYSTPNKTQVIDIPTKMKLLPGNSYEYYHVGKNDSKIHLNNLNVLYNNGLTYNPSILSITQWLSSPLIDDSVYKNNGLAYNTTQANFKVDYFKFTGTEYIVFPAKTELLPVDNLTISMWLYSDNWQDLKGYQVFGNYYNGGVGLINDSRIFMPFLSIINNATKKLYNFNYRFGNTSTLTLPSTAETTNFNFIQRLSDYTYWVFDSSTMKAVKYDVDDRILVSTGLYLSTIDQVETDSSENLYIYDNASKSYNVIDPTHGLPSGGGTVPQYANRIEIDLFDNVVPVYGNASVIDNNNVLWETIGNNLYKAEYDSENLERPNRNVFAIVGPTKQITCDFYNNIWLLLKNDEYVKIDPNGNFVFAISFAQATLPDEPNCPPAPLIPAIDESGLIEDLQFLSDTNYTFIVDDFLNLFIVTKPAPAPSAPPVIVYNRVRSLNFINSPIANTTICTLSSTNQDQAVLVDQTENDAYIIDQNGLPVIKTNFQGLLGKNEKLSIVANGDFTGYQNVRKYRNAKNNLSWKFKYTDSTGVNQQLTALNYSVSAISKGWHHIAFTFDGGLGNVKYYIDSKIVDSFDIDQGSTIAYEYRSSFVLGTTTLKNTTLNNILNIDDGYNFVGSVADLRMYNRTLNNSDVEQIYRASNFSPENETLHWNIPIGAREYVEEIKHWFQYRLPASKSKYYNINIHNLNVDSTIKANIELAIKNIINKISPAYSELNKIGWK